MSKGLCYWQWNEDGDVGWWLPESIGVLGFPWFGNYYKLILCIICLYKFKIINNIINIFNQIIIVIQNYVLHIQKFCFITKGKHMG